MPLHLTKVAYGHDSLPDLDDRIRLCARQGGLVLTTRYLPKRHEQVVDGGSLYWIIKHQLVARSAILGFGDAEGGRVAIHLEPRLILVRPQPKRAHQGWRYLEDKDAPSDLGDEEDDAIAAMPPELVGKLGELALI
ncbi:DUF1489 domain-containing protein [Stakelama saccharophila]|uniref:DUF1489 domain-containing protein n=1 Tax=Stakelama saccharophila TaxID=3075605 RepID=A0ABZ0BBC4_9SPHN|nr:DUF1489 domain-containing protein [Stakelama sp. W311]WNO53981.1 DUF1489 domain-containing protein [Stakelama sp. W311]